MVWEKTGLLILANLIPAVEQVGGIPTGIALGFDPLTAFLISLTVNISLFIPVYFGLQLFYKKVFSRIKIFNKFLEKGRAKVKPYVDKYGVIGVAFFIALPGPLTGTYTASAVSWALNLDWKKAWMAIALGSTIGGIMILIASVGGLFFLHTIGY